jgi:hypothetical protein
VQHQATGSTFPLGLRQDILQLLEDRIALGHRIRIGQTVDGKRRKSERARFSVRVECVE